MLWAGGGSRFGEAKRGVGRARKRATDQFSAVALQFGNLLFERAIDLLHDPALLINQGEIRGDDRRMLQNAGHQQNPEY